MKTKTSSVLVRAAVLVGSLVAAAAMGSCADPVHDLQVKALGGEKDGVPTGEYHRAGQPCLVCHGGLGPASSEFLVAGTVFHGKYKPVGELGVAIELVDANGSRPARILTNCVGNFSITAADWAQPAPSYPLLVAIRKPNSNDVQVMNSHIGREGSCNACHRDPISFDTPGHIFLYNDENATPADCPVSPVADIPGNQPPK